MFSEPQGLATLQHDNMDKALETKQTEIQDETKKVK